MTGSSSWSAYTRQICKRQTTIRSVTSLTRRHAIWTGMPPFGHSPLRQRPFKIVGELSLAKLPKLRRQFRPRRRLYASTRQCRSRKVCAVGDLKLPTSIFVTNCAHFLHPHPSRCGAVQGNGRIRKRQSASPTTGDAVPSAVLVQQRSAKAHRSNGDVLSGHNVGFHAADVRLPNIDLDRCLLPKQQYVLAQDHQIEIVRGDVRSCGGPNDDHRDHVGVALCAFKKGGEPMERRCRWPPVYRALDPTKTTLRRGQLLRRRSHCSGLHPAPSQLGDYHASSHVHRSCEWWAFRVWLMQRAMEWSDGRQHGAGDGHHGGCPQAQPPQPKAFLSPCSSSSAKNKPSCGMLCAVSLPSIRRPARCGG